MIATCLKVKGRFARLRAWAKALGSRSSSHILMGLFSVFSTFFMTFSQCGVLYFSFIVGYPQLATGIEPATTTSIMVLYIAGYHVHRGLHKAFGVPLLILL
jgi:hypothetical protein